MYLLQRTTTTRVSFFIAVTAAASAKILLFHTTPRVFPYSSAHNLIMRIIKIFQIGISCLGVSCGGGGCVYSNPPLLRSYYKNENFFFGEWPILRMPMSKEPSRDHQGQVGIIATHRSMMAGNDPQGPPKCDSRQSWHCGAIDSKNDSLTRLLSLNIG